MSKMLILKPRQADGLGGFGWHDYNLLVNAIGAIVKGKDAFKAAMWHKIALNAQRAVNAAGLFKNEPWIDEDGEQVTNDLGKRVYRPRMVEIEVSLGNNYAQLLWNELCRLRRESFSASGQNVPNFCLLSEMLDDWARDLGEKMPEGDNEGEGDDGGQENA